MPEPTIHIVEDDASVRDSLLLLLQLKGLRAAGFESADAFLAAMRPEWSGCLLVDLRMPGTTGLELQGILRERGNTMPIIIITAHGDVAAARRAFISGAVDFLEKPLDESALLAAIDKAMAVDRERRDAQALAAGRDARIARLSRREREVLWLAGDGCQNREIAEKLGLSPRTVEIYKARMMEKLQIRGLPELLRFLRGVQQPETAIH
jgi:FixJ family two-component response regulator